MCQTTNKLCLTTLKPCNSKISFAYLLLYSIKTFEPSIKINNVQITQVKQTKFLGLFMSIYPGITISKIKIRYLTDYLLFEIYLSSVLSLEILLKV